VLWNGGVRFGAIRKVREMSGLIVESVCTVNPTGGL